MSLPYPDPSNPALPSPLFSDLAAARGDHLRANNAAIFADLKALDDRNPAIVALTSGSFKTAALANADTYNGRSEFTCTAGVTDTPYSGAWRITGVWNPTDSSGRFTAKYDTSLDTWEINYSGGVWGSWKKSSGDIITGSIMPYGGSSAPSGWLLCDGSSLDRAAYDDLYSAITSSKGTVTITEANPGVATLNGHGFVTGDRIELTTTGTLPTNLAVFTNYFVIYVNANTFRLATTYANAVAGTAIDTSGMVQSGVHTLRHMPFGGNGVNNFLLPDLRAVALKGYGAQTINGNAKTSPPLGVPEEDRYQGHKFTFPGRNAAGGWIYNLQEDGANLLMGGSGTYTADYDTFQSGRSIITAHVTDGTNGTPRTGITTRDNAVGVNYIIKY